MHANGQAVESVLPAEPLTEFVAPDAHGERHSGWVRSVHWIITASFLALAVSGFVIFMCHPRLYWGEVGNDLTPALFELPVSRNYKHGGWTNTAAFFSTPGSPVSASRTYPIFNQNSWGRSLHFLAAWFLVVPGAIYLLLGAITGHFWKRIVPRSRDLTFGAFANELRAHLRLRIRPAAGGPRYGLLQKCAYLLVIFVALPLAVITGLAMSPAINGAYPFLTDCFGGQQSARTVHFFVSFVLVLFVAVHLLMVVLSGFKRQMRGMILGR